METIDATALRASAHGYSIPIISFNQKPDTRTDFLICFVPSGRELDAGPDAMACFFYSHLYAKPTKPVPSAFPSAETH
jgi:hypothetical protein